jgi:hypothetical protein
MKKGGKSPGGYFILNEKLHKKAMYSFRIIDWQIKSRQKVPVLMLFLRNRKVQKGLFLQLNHSEAVQCFKLAFLESIGHNLIYLMATFCSRFWGFFA